MTAMSMRAVCVKCNKMARGMLARCPNPMCRADNSITWRQVATPERAKPVAVTQANGAIHWKDVTGAELPRVDCGIPGINQLLGGGIEDKNMILFSGEPGCGKSTLVAQLSGHLAKTAPVIYGSGEETKEAVAKRLRRLGISEDANVILVETTEVEKIYEAIREHGPCAVVIDSVQKFRSRRCDSEAGSVDQIKTVANELYDLCHDATCDGFITLLIGHVTKDGRIAGPKALDHVADATIMFEGERGDRYKMIRALKSRMGATGLVVMEMDGTGLHDVQNASGLFLSGRRPGSVGSVVTVIAEDSSQPMLLEVQALTYPGGTERVARGLDTARMKDLVLILTRRADIDLSETNVRLAIAGDVDMKEPAADLAAAFAIYSQTAQLALLPDVVVFGEVGLTGEVRPVPRTKVRIEEGVKLGFKRFVIPVGSLAPDDKIKGAIITTIGHTDEIETAFNTVGMKPNHRARKVVQLASVRGTKNK